MLLQMGDVLTSLRMKEGASRVRQSTGGPSKGMKWQEK